MMLRAYQDRFTWQREWEFEKVKLLATVLGAEFKDTATPTPPRHPAQRSVTKPGGIVETYD